MIIPPDINNRSLLDAARFYRDELRWTVHALQGPDDGAEHERGKKPVEKGWKKRRREDTTDAYLLKYFGNGHRRNLGLLVQPPHIVIDLDSKSDAGASVEAWLAAHPVAQHWPRERTTGGVHLHVICRDVPSDVIASAGRDHKLESRLAEKVTCEVFLGSNVVVAPSLHKSGKPYAWEQTGPLPEIPWVELARLFSIAPKSEPNEPRSVKRSALFWMTRFKGDLATLDIVALARDLGFEPRLIDADAGKHAIRCPWTDAHTTATDPRNDTGTVLFEPRDGHLPGFKCLHVSHGEKSLADFLNHCEDRKAGCVDAHCTQMRVWSEGQKSGDGRPRLILPGPRRPQSDFAEDAGDIMAGNTGADGLFVRNDLLVEVQPMRLSRNAATLGFSILKPVRAITFLEKFAEVGSLDKDPAGQPVFTARSMGEGTAKALLASPQFREPLPVVERILDIPQPILRSDNSIGYPRSGYDPEFRTFLNPAAPKIKPMTLDAARALFQQLLSEFCFADEQSLVHALAALITPFCRGLFGRWNDRTPVWLYKANRERAGKDFLAALAPLLYEGRANEDAPLNSDEPETRKKITAALIAGRRRIHFANCRGHINNAAFEMVATATTWSDRRLGENAEVTLSNELEISLSGNTGLSYTPDFANRCRIIMLHYEEEHANARKFTCPDLHGWLLKNRSIFVSALAALVEHWHQCGRPRGPGVFTSFPIWASVVGGIMHAAGLGDPCRPQDEDNAIDGDRQTADMKTLFAQGHEQFGEAWVKKDQIYELVTTGDAELFSWLDLSTRNDKTRFGLMFRRFAGRVLGGIRLNVNETARKSQQHTYQFTALQGTDPGDRRQTILNGVFGGHLGHVGHVANPTRKDPENKNTGEEKERREEINKSMEKVPKVPNVPITERDELPTIATAISAHNGPVALDIETFGRGGAALDPWRGNIRLLSLAISGHHPWLLDLQAIGYDLGPLGSTLNRATLLGHNIKFDALWLSAKIGLQPSKLLDTLTASRLLTAGTFEPNDLASLAERYLKVTMDKTAGSVSWGGALLPAQLRYAANDVAHLHDLHAALGKALASANLSNAYKLEMDLLPHVVDMEARGFPVDRAELEKNRDEAVRKADEAASQLRQLFGNPQLNPASPPQLKAALASKGVSVESTGEAALIAARDTTYIPAILAHRTASKRASQAESLIEAIADDGRIHARFEPMGTDTGRFSSRDPNLQNVERGPIRAAFAAPSGHSLIVADYSQVELRVAAAIAGENKMIEAYKRGLDLHRVTAALVLDKKLADVTKEDRQLAKAVNFGLLYGQRARGLVGYAKAGYGVELSEARAHEIRDRFFRAYHKLAEWQNRNYEQSANRTEVRTITGRRQLVRFGDDARWSRFASSLNTPVQGGSADGIKRAIILISERLPAGCGLISTVHDELIALAPDALAHEAKKIVESSMIEAMHELFPAVPIEVECAVCKNWSEKSDHPR